MLYEKDKTKDIKIAYIGGGSRGWAWGLMSDLATAGDMSGSVFLYDIDYQAAKNNESIGNKIKECDDCQSAWKYKAVETIGEALTGADFVVISILPGTFDEMQSDVHAPEKYGIYQSVGDTTGPGGIIRALRTIPMIEEIAKSIEKYSPDAWVINYTNPMAVCVKTLYETFPKIKAFGCCHEVFGTQILLKALLEKMCGIQDVERKDIIVDVLGLNHFTWITSAQYKNIDIFELYPDFIEKCQDDAFLSNLNDDHWVNNKFITGQKVKFDLFHRYGYIAAAGDRHLAEFCDGNQYLKNPETVKDWGFELTSVQWRKDDLKERMAKMNRLLSGEEKFEIKKTGEEGVNQMRALLGLTTLVTNVNLPNMGQIPNLPLGAVVETNAAFRTNSLHPVISGELPESILPRVKHHAEAQLKIVEGGRKRDLDTVFDVFVGDPLVKDRIKTEEAHELFERMIENTKEYLKDYFK